MLDHGELENRLRDKNALGPCPACGDPEADRLDPTAFGLILAESINAMMLGVQDSPPQAVRLYAAICPSCGYVRLFTPEVVRAEEAG